MADLNLEAKTDRELLLLTAQATNELKADFVSICNRQDIAEKEVENLNTRITKVEVKSGFIALVISVCAGIGSWFANR